MAAFGRKTPPNVVVFCLACGRQVSTAAKGTAQEVIGWLAPRTGGGPNHIRYQKPTGRYAHVGCLDEASDPVHANQASLFGKEKT